VPTDFKARIRLLQTKTDRVERVNKAERLLRKLADAGEAFSRRCAGQTVQLYLALDYLLDPMLDVE
jgi:hypothetical protein